MKPINGVVTGIVTRVRAGEVKLKFPWLHEREDEERESNWARIAAPMAGNDRGTFLMPEVEDEVLVAFEKGSFEHPYVIGFLWNGKDKSPDTDTQKRVMKTKSGHVVTFNDNPGSEGITIQSQGGQKIEIKDGPPGSITIETQMGNKISLDESAGGSISLTALTDISLTAPKISFITANLTVSSPTFNLGAGPTTFTGPLNIVGNTTITGTTAITGTTTIIGPSIVPTNPMTGTLIVS